MESERERERVDQSERERERDRERGSETREWRERGPPRGERERGSQARLGIEHLKREPA